MANLKDKKIIYTFDTWEDCEDLMQYLKGEGITWVEGQNPIEWKLSNDTFYNANQILVGLCKGRLSYVKKYWCKNSSVYEDYEKIHWKKKKDVSLAEFLGWEENVEYRRNGKIYKVKGEKLMILENDYHRKKVHTKTWEVVWEVVDLKNAEKHEPKYFARIKGWELLPNDIYYFRWDEKRQTLTLGSNDTKIQSKGRADVFSYMTKEEWKKHGVNEDNAEFFEEKCCSFSSLFRQF